MTRVNYFDCRNLLGEDLGPLNTKELEQLERQLDSSLKQVRSTKVMMDNLSMLVFHKKICKSENYKLHCS